MKFDNACRSPICLDFIGTFTSDHYMYDTVACALSYCQLRILVCATARYFSSQKCFNLPFSPFPPPQYFYILRAFIIKNPAVFWYHWFKLLGLLSRFLFHNTCAIQLCCNCINTPLHLLHFRNINVISEDMVFASTWKYATLLLISFTSCIRRGIYCFCWLFAALRFSELTWLVFCTSTELFISATDLSLSATTRLSSSSSTIFASFTWHQVVLIFFGKLSMQIWSWYLAVSISLEYLHLWESSWLLDVTNLFSAHSCSSIFSRFLNNS